MTYEEMERTMQFILEQQAQFSANHQQADERATRLETSVAELTADQQQVRERVALIEKNMAEMARTQAHVNEVLVVMLDTHQHTERKLDAFIGVLERYMSEDRNGKSNGESAT